MEFTQKLEEMLRQPVEEAGVKLYEVVWHAHDHTLEVSILKPDGTIDLDTCALVSDIISEVLDREDPIDCEYTLDVCSPGAEREIKDLDELDQMTNAYVYVRFKEPVKNLNDVTGEIVSVADGVIEISYRDKAAVRKVQFEKDNIQFIRMAVRI